MRTKLFALLVVTSLAGIKAHAGNDSIGVVNFTTCVTDSKLGKQEQASFESLKKQMSTLLEDTEKKLSEISAKFNDHEFMDGLSPEGEAELKAKFQSLNEEMNRYQNQYYQVLQQANMHIIQNVSNNIKHAAEKVAKDKKLSVVLTNDACFYYSTEVTPQVIAEMDKEFDIQAKANPPAPTPTPASNNEPAAPAKGS